MLGPVGRSPARSVTRVVCWLLVAFLVAGLAYLVHRAIVLRIDYWDSYLYLNNARCMLGDSAARYQLDKPPVLPALYMPAAALTEEPATVAQYVVPHLFAVVLAVGSMLAVFALFRHRLSLVFALAGVVLCAGNRIFVHYANYCLADVISLGFVAAAYAAWFKAREQREWRWFVLTGVLIALAVGTRYQNALFPIGIALAEIVIAIRNRQVPDRRFLGFGVASLLSLVLWLVFHKLTYDAIGREFSVKSLMGALEYAGAGAQREYEREAAWQYFRMLPGAISPIVIALAIAGLVVGAVQRQDRDILFFFFLVFVGGPLFRVDHNEIRYLYAAFPALIYFAFRPLELLPRFDWFRRALASTRGNAIVASVGGIALLVSIVPALDQARRDQDPFFTSDVFRSSSAWLLENRQEGAPLLWYGRPHTLHPSNPMQFDDDEYWNIFHLHAHIIEYFTREHMNEQYWRGQAADAVLRAEGTPTALFYGTPDDLHAWEVTVRDRPSDPVQVFVSHVWTLERTGDGFAGSGIVLRRSERGLVSDTDLGEVELGVVEPSPRRIGPVTVTRDRAIADVGDATSLRLFQVESAAFGVPGFMDSAGAAGDEHAARAERDR
jgi:hypothetical protein